MLLSSEAMYTAMVIFLCHLQGWTEPVDAGAIGGAASAILIFMPGAPEIGRLLRALQASTRLKRACPQGVRLLPLHGALSAKDQVTML